MGHDPILQHDYNLLKLDIAILTTEVNTLKKSIHGKGGWEEERNKYFEDIKRLTAEVERLNRIISEGEEWSQGRIERNSELRTIIKNLIEKVEELTADGGQCGDVTVS